MARETVWMSQQVRCVLPFRYTAEQYRDRSNMAAFAVCDELIPSNNAHVAVPHALLHCAGVSTPVHCTVGWAPADPYRGIVSTSDRRLHAPRLNFHR
jgi:hypothetical protein